MVGHRAPRVRLVRPSHQHGLPQATTPEIGWGAGLRGLERATARGLAVRAATTLDAAHRDSRDGSGGHDAGHVDEPILLATDEHVAVAHEQRSAVVVVDVEPAIPGLGVGRLGDTRPRGLQRLRDAAVRDCIRVVSTEERIHPQSALGDRRTDPNGFQLTSDHLAHPAPVSRWSLEAIHAARRPSRRRRVARNPFEQDAAP